MRTTNGTQATYDAQNAIKQKKPVVHVDISGMTNDYVSGTFSGIAGNDQKLLSGFRYRVPQFDFLRGVQEPGQMEIEIVDKDQTFTSDLNTNPIFGQTATVDLGYQELALVDMIQLPAQSVQGDIEIGPDFRTYRITTSDLRRKFIRKIGSNFSVTLLNGDMSNSNSLTSFTVDSTSSFPDPTNMPSVWPNRTGQAGNESLYLKIENELVGYGDITATTFTGGSGGAFIQRGLNNVGNVAHVDNTAVYQVLYFWDFYPSEALLFLLMTTDDGSGHPYYDLATHDANFQGLGLGLTTAEVDVEQIERLGWKYFDLNWEACQNLCLHQEENSLEWIAKNILIPGGLILYEDSSTGLLRIQTLDRLEFWDSFSTDQDLTRDNIEIESYVVDNQKVLNNILLKFQGDPLTGTHSRELHTQLDDSVTNYAESELFEIRSPLINDLTVSATWDRFISKAISRRWHYTYGNPTDKLTFSALPEYWLLETNDSIRITHDQMPDVDAGTLGWTNKQFYITGQTIDALSNPPQYQFNAVGFDAFTEIATWYNFTTVAQGDIDDTDIAFNSDFSDTIDTEDATENTGTTSAHVFIFDIQITPPNTGTTHHWITLGWRAMSGGVAQATGSYPRIRYYSGDSAAFTIRLIGFRSEDPVGFTEIDFDRLKVDWYEASATAVSGERPSTITLTQIQYSALQSDISVQ